MSVKALSGASAPTLPRNSLDFTAEVLNHFLPPSLIKMCHDPAFPQKEYLKPKVVVLSGCECLKVALLTILSLGIYLVYQYSSLEDALEKGDLKAAEQAVRNGGNLFYHNDLNWWLVKRGKIAEAAFLLAQNPHDGTIAHKLDHLSEFMLPKNTQKYRQIYQNGLTVWLLTDESNSGRYFLQQEFHRVLQKKDYETAKLFFQFGKTCNELVNSTEGIMDVETMRFLIENGLSVEKVRIDYNTLFWHSVNHNNLGLGQLLLEHVPENERWRFMNTSGTYITPLQLAWSKGYTDIEKFLKEKGALWHYDG